MKKIALAILLASGAAMPQTAMAADIAGLANTGVDVAGGADGIDDNWALTGGTAYTTTNGSFPLGPWMANDSTSSWITPSSPQGQTDPVGNFIYNLSFDLDSSLDAATAAFTGRFAVDNQVTSITLNGFELLAGGPVGGFTSWTNFAANDHFQSGGNTLQFTTYNQPCNGCSNPNGLRVEFLSSVISAVPEPTTWALMIFGFLAVGTSMRRRRTGKLSFA